MPAFCHAGRLVAVFILTWSVFTIYKECTSVIFISTNKTAKKIRRRDSNPEFSFKFESSTSKKDCRPELNTTVTTDIQPAMNVKFSNLLIAPIQTAWSGSSIDGGGTTVQDAASPQALLSDQDAKLTGADVRHGSCGRAEQRGTRRTYVCFS